MSVGRNDDCPCGSGTKFKRCCESKTAQGGLPRGLIALIGVIVALAGIGFIPAIIEDDEQRPSTQAAATASPAPIQASAAGTAQPLQASPQSSASSSQPAGKPPGGVWSAEHGHWHQAGSKPTPAASPINIQVDRGPQPVEVGGAQAAAGAGGNVWSAEHGHWHKGASAPATGNLAALKQAVATPMAPTPDNPSGVRIGGKSVTTLAQRPSGEAPPGQIWSAEHGHWHDARTGKAPAPATTPAAETKKD